MKLKLLEQDNWLDQSEQTHHVLRLLTGGWDPHLFGQRLLADKLTLQGLLADGRLGALMK
jgi:hypothetical protein